MGRMYWPILGIALGTPVLGLNLWLARPKSSLAPMTPRAAAVAPDLSPVAPVAAVEPKSEAAPAAVVLLAEPQWLASPAPSNAAAGALTTEEIAARCEASVALVRGEKGLGTGFLARPGILVTNAHVIAAERLGALRVTFPSAPVASRHAAIRRLLWESAGRDLALLEVDSSLPPLEIESTYRFRRGQDVTVIGNPGTGAGDVLENAVSRGVMSARVTYKDHAYFQMSIAINPGNSGGPVFGSEGGVVGVATLKDASREGIAFCVPADELAVILARVSAQPERFARRATAAHGYRPLLALLDQSAATYARTLDALAAVMDQEAARGGDPAAALPGAEHAFRQRFGNSLHRFTVETIYPAVRRAGADPNLSTEARRDLVALWSVVLDLQKQAEQPTGDSGRIRAQARSLAGRHAQLRASVQSAFDGEGR